MKLLLAIIFKEIKYLENLRMYSLLKFFYLILQVTIFYFFSIQISKDYFKFLFIGLIFSRIIYYCLNSLNESLRQEQFWQTTYLLFSLPYDEITIFLALYISKIIFLLFEIFLYIVIGIILGVKFNLHLILLTYIFSIISIFTLIPITFLSSSLIISVKKSENILMTFTTFIDIATGVYFPIEILPKFLSWFSNILPMTYQLRFLREIILNNRIEILTLLYPTIFFIFSLPLSTICIKFSIKKSLIRGSLLNY